MKKVLMGSMILLQYSLLSGQTVADPQKYSALTIADSLKTNAHSVLRLEERIVDVQSPSRYNLTNHTIVTLLNKEAAAYFRQSFWFNKFHKVDEVEIRLYNGAGQEVRKYRKKDLETRAAVDYESLHTDDKLLTLQIPAQDFPCTLDIYETQKAYSYINLPGIHFNTPEESVEQVRFVVNIPTDLDLHYKVNNIDIKPVVTTQANIKTYVWEAKNLKAVLPERQSYHYLQVSPHIEIAPNYFEYDGYKGQLGSWKDFGAWNYALYEEQAAFTPEREAVIKQLVAHCKTDREKIDVLYSHLKKTMRYVSIQLGIGGFKPFAVKFVDDKKYGDCKALTNYMRYLLKTVNIKAYPALINSGSDRMPADPAFPIDNFNHVILCVPMGKDSVWLECTSNNNETGVLGSSTENKNALLLTENGGILVSTPASRSEENIYASRTIVTVSKEGTAEASSVISCTGSFWDIFDYMQQQSDDDKKDMLIRHLNYKAPDDLKFNHDGIVNGANQFTLALKYDQLYEFKAGSKYFYRPRLNRICDEAFIETKTRKHSYLFRNAYNKTDTTIYQLPENYSIEVGTPKQFNNKFGHYKMKVLKGDTGNSWTVISEFSIYQNIIPAAEYPIAMELLKRVHTYESEKIVIKEE